jgi:hypothetical protein
VLSALPPRNAAEGLAPARTSLASPANNRNALELLIEGGTKGEVCRAVDTGLPRKAKLELQHPDTNRSDAVGGLFRNGRERAALTHPEADAIHDLSQNDGLFYVGMELVNGMSLLASNVMASREGIVKVYDVDLARVDRPSFTPQELAVIGAPSVPPIPAPTPTPAA